MYPKTKQLIHALTQQKVVPGVSYAILTPNICQSECFGYSQLFFEKQLLRPNMLYDVASLTKVIGTTTVILKLIEQKFLKFTDPIYQYLPFENKKVTVLHLLTHTAALCGYIKNRNQ